jgi:anti-sigma regulatory factor (Ser/Thr protein kinase)
VAVGEAATNAIVHAYGPAPERFLVEATADQQGIRVAVRDRGRWRASRRTRGGRGTEIMRAFMDKVDIMPDADGTTVTLYRSLHAETPSA